MKRAEGVLALAGAAALVAAAYGAPWLKFVLTIALAKGIAVLGIMLLLHAGQVSFGHALYIAAAAYAVAFLAPVMPDALLLLPTGALVSALVGLAVGLFVARYRDLRRKITGCLIVDTPPRCSEPRWAATAAPTRTWSTS